MSFYKFASFINLAIAAFAGIAAVSHHAGILEGADAESLLGIVVSCILIQLFILPWFD